MLYICSGGPCAQRLKTWPVIKKYTILFKSISSFCIQFWLEHGLLDWTFSKVSKPAKDFRRNQSSSPCWPTSQSMLSMGSLMSWLKFVQISLVLFEGMVKRFRKGIQFSYFSPNAIDSKKLAVEIHVQKNHVQHCEHYAHGMNSCWSPIFFLPESLTFLYASKSYH